MKEKNKKTNKTKLIAGLVILALLLGVGSCSLMKEQDDHIKVQDIDYLTCVSGLRDWTVEQGTEKVDYLNGVQWIESYVKDVTFDDSQVDLSQEGTYELIYVIHAVDETVQDVQKKVTVKVLAKEEAEQMVSDGQEIVTNDGVQNEIKVEKPKEPTKPVEKPEEPSKPEEPEKPAHTHDYKPVYKTVHHEEEGHYEKVCVKEAWDEEVPIYEEKEVFICVTCSGGWAGVETTPYIMETNEERLEHGAKHLRDEIPGSSQYTVRSIKTQTGTKTVHHDAEYKNQWVVDKKAWDEQVIDYYICECGKRK